MSDILNDTKKATFFGFFLGAPSDRASYSSFQRVPNMAVGLQNSVETKVESIWTLGGRTKYISLDRFQSNSTMRNGNSLSQYTQSFHQRFQKSSDLRYQINMTLQRALLLHVNRIVECFEKF